VRCEKKSPSTKDFQSSFLARNADVLVGISAP
jgi:hypothetical protein